MRVSRHLSALVTAAAVATTVTFGMGGAPVAAEAGEARPGAPRAAAQVVAAGDEHSCVIIESGAGPGGDVRCWGGNAYGQLGLGDTSSRGDQVGELASTPTINIGAKAVAISAGRWHTCALLTGGSVKCWGRNESGQLGRGDTSNRGDGILEMGVNLIATDLGAGRTATMIAAGGSFTCALLDNASVKCWGANASGQLGLGDTAARGDNGSEMGNALQPVNFGAGVVPVSIVAGRDHVCAIVVESTVRSLRCWGENSEGQLGLGSTTDRGDGPAEVASAAPVFIGVTNVSALALGRAHTCALAGEVVACWGANNSGQLGRGTVGQARGDAAGEMADVGGSFMEYPSPVALTAMSDGTCVMAVSTQRPVCWGEGGRGQLGIDSSADVGGPSFSVTSAQTTKLIDPVAAMSGGDAHLCLVLTTRDVKCIGASAAGQLGTGTTYDIGESTGDTAAGPKMSMGAPLLVQAHDAGEFHQCAIVTGGAVKCWGTGFLGALGGTVAVNSVIGDHPGEIAALPEVQLGTGRTAVQISAGSYVTCAVLDNGTLKCWGNNASGQLGLGHVSTTGTSPSQMGDALPAVRLGTGRTVTKVSVGTDHVCAILDDATLKCWGKGLLGRLGTGNPSNLGDDLADMGDALPVVNLGAGRTAVDVSAGDSHTCALLDNGTVKCWGAGGLLGLGDNVTRGDNAGEMGDNLPTVDLGTGRTAVALAAESTTCAVLDNGNLKCWGGNLSGAAGNGSATIIGDQAGEMGDNLPAVPLGTGRTATDVDSSYGTTCVRLDNAKLKCWGANGVGQAGTDDVVQRGDGANEMGDNLPAVKLQSGVTPQNVTVGEKFACTTSTTAQLWCWGGSPNHGQGYFENGIGDELGDMATLVPVDIGVTPYKTLVVAAVAGVPDAPRDLVAVGGAQSAELAWTAPSDNGAAVTGYRIEHATSLAGPWTTAVADTGSTATTGVVSGLPLSATVYVRVRAINAVGVGAPAVSTAFATRVAYIPLTPFRLADTRTGATTGDGQGAATGQLAAGGELVVQVSGRGNVPMGAKAVVINLAAVLPAASGFLTVWSCDDLRPQASNLNFVPGRTTPNAAYVKLSATGTICVYANQPTHVIVDVNGVYPSGSAFNPLTPARLVDTRPGGSTVEGGFEGSDDGRNMILAGQAPAFTVAGVGGLPSSPEISAVVLNVTASQAQTNGFLTVYPCSGGEAPRPTASNLNFIAGRAIANTVVTAVSGSGSICVYASQATHVIIDVVGYLPVASGYRSLTPFRLADSRSEGVSGDGQGVNTGLLGVGQTLTIQVRGRGGIPANATAAVINVVAVTPQGTGFLTVYPCDAARPNASSLNAAGQTVPNLVVAKLSAAGTICIYTAVATHVVVDLVGAERL